SQLLYTLPVSLFGMAVSAAELPYMSAATGSREEVATYLRGRLDGGLQRIAYFIIPSAVAFFTLGDVVSAALYESGRFSRSDSIWVWQVLAGSTIGLLASTWGRLYSSTFYAMRDARTPLNFAIVRVSVAAVTGYVAALYLPQWLGVDRKYGAAFLTAASGAAGWLEFLLLRREMKKRIGHTSIKRAHTFRLWFAALTAAAIAWGFKLGFHTVYTVWIALGILASYGLSYLIITTLMRVPEAVGLSSRILRQR
ncbi:MAG TPA: lipid II flippase MurJ, partial [Gemmatimonadaceae bacterium]|nr:lipid II flippase MurJ [Gemmatimonadaceae bacterium]